MRFCAEQLANAPSDAAKQDQLSSTIKAKNWNVFCLRMVRPNSASHPAQKCTGCTAVSPDDLDGVTVLLELSLLGGQTWCLHEKWLVVGRMTENRTDAGE